MRDNRVRYSWWTYETRRELFQDGRVTKLILIWDEISRIRIYCSNSCQIEERDMVELQSLESNLVYIYIISSILFWLYFSTLLNFSNQKNWRPKSSVYIHLLYTLIQSLYHWHKSLHRYRSFDHLICSRSHIYHNRSWSSCDSHTSS